MNSETLRRTLLDMSWHGTFMNIKFTENPDPPLAFGPMEVIANGTYFHFPLLEWVHGNSTAIWPPAEAQGPWVVPPNVAGIIAPIIGEALPAIFAVAPVTFAYSVKFVLPYL